MKVQLDQDSLYSAFNKVDNWRDFGYSTRILDAFASLFHLKAPVTAVYKFQGKLFLSYNTQAEERIKSQVKLCNIFLKEGSVNDLLNFYLLMNTDFIDLIVNQCKCEWQKLYNKECKTGLNFKQFKEQYIKENKLLPESLFKLENFIASYKKVSSLSEKPFVELIIQKNNQIKEANKISNIQAKEDFLKKSELSFIKEEEKLLISVAKDYKNFYIINDYIDLVLNLGIDKTEFKELLIHPLQDCHKIFYLMKNGYTVDDVVILDNKAGVHADINVVDNFPLIEKFDYLGVSRLACGYCHEYLDKKGVPHRGSHGIIDPNWKMNLSSPQEEPFKIIVQSKSKKLEKEHEPIQHRRLSYDFFEKDIQLDEKNTLCKLKCDLLGSHNYDVADEYGYYVFTGEGYIQIG